MGVVQSYQGLLRSWLARFNEEITKEFLQGWETNPVHFMGAVPHFDALQSPGSSYVRKRLGSVNLILEEAIKPGSKISTELRVLAARVNKKGDFEFRKTVGISPRSDLGLGAELDFFRDSNVGLIKSLAGNQINDITGILADAEIQGLRVEEVRSQLEAKFGVTKSKADLLARDQVLKLNGKLTLVRQTGSGITHYVWTTSGDERVRGTPGGKWPKGLHFDLDGKTFPWNAPPICSEDGRREHPGGDYQCRCTAYPILPELLNFQEPSAEEAEALALDD